MTTTLNGTEKQVAWATEIKTAFFTIAAKRNIPAELLKKFEIATNAGWWIQNKPTANTVAQVIVSALTGGLISVAEKNVLAERYNIR